MAMQNATNLRRFHKQVRIAVLVGVAGAALAGGVVLGVQRSQQHSHGQLTTVSSAAPAAVAVSQPRGTTPVYLVHSEEQAQALRAWQALGSTGGPDGMQPAAVVLAPSAAEASFASAALQQEGDTVFASAASDTATAVTPVSRRPATTAVYLARTPEEEEEQALRTWVAQGSFDVPAGAAPQASVILAPSAAEADFARGAILNWLHDAGAAPTVLDARTIEGS